MRNLLTAAAAAAIIGCKDEAPADIEVGPSALVFDGARPANLLLISVDTLRRDALGRYGGGDTPTLDALFEEGVALDAHKSCSNWTYASMICALAGAGTEQLGFEPYGAYGGGAPEPLPGEIALLGELLGVAGYAGGIVTTNPFLGKRYQMTGGLELVVETSWEQPASADVVTDEALALADALSRGGDPWFLHAHYLDPHAPYAPPEGYLDGLDALAPIDFDLGTPAGITEVTSAYPDLDADTQALIREHAWLRYRGAVRYTDDELGRLLDGLRDRGLLADTLLLFVSDHGEQFWDHGNFGHGHKVYGEEVDVAALFWAEGLQAAAFTEPTTHADLAPTALVGLGLEGWDFQGRVIGRDPDPDFPWLAHHYDGSSTIQSAQRGDMKLVYSWADGHFELYNRGGDPAEAADRYAPGDPDAAALWALMAPQTERLLELYPEPGVSLAGP